MAEYIEREAYSAELAKGTIITDDLYGMGIMSGLDYAMKKLKEQPAADVAPVVHGRWISVPSSDTVMGKAYTCSECEKMRFGSFKPNYCPNCGARMDGE